MNMRLLNVVFSEIKEDSSLDFALMDVAMYGKTTPEIRKAITAKYGETAKGIWVRPQAQEAESEEDVIYVMPFNLNGEELKDITASFSAYGYYVLPYNGNGNIGGFFSLEEIPEEKRRRKFFVDTPMGILKAYANPGQSILEYPGVSVDIIVPNSESIPLACVECDSCEQSLAVDVYDDAQYDDQTIRTTISNFPPDALWEDGSHVYCPNCIHLVPAYPMRNKDGDVVSPCPVCGTHFNPLWYRFVNEKEAHSIIETRRPLGKFVQKDGKHFIGIDNEDGECWVEEFTDLESCAEWLI